MLNSPTNITTATSTTTPVTPKRKKKGDLNYVDIEEKCNVTVVGPYRYPFPGDSP
jgi:hypothetical protein